MNLFLRRALCGMALIVAAIGTAGCQHESQAEQEEVRTVSYRAVMQSDKPVPEKVNTWLGAMSQEDKIGQLMMISLHGSTVGQSQKDVIRKYRVSGVMLTNENLNNKNQVKAFTNDIMQTATTASMVTPYIGINRDKVLSTNESFLRLPAFYKNEKELKAKALELLKIFDLDGDAETLAKNLAYGQQRRLEIVRALATEPKILFLDEPAAGMNPQETAELTELIRRIKDEFKITIMLIEHDMNLVMEVTERIYVLEYGRLIAHGTPDEIKNNKRVIEAYLGGEA